VTFPFKTKPLAHQATEFDVSCDSTIRGLFWDMGLGKSKELIDQMAHLWREGEIEAALVVAPNSVHRNWVTDELPKHLHDDAAENCRAIYYEAGRAGTKRHRGELNRVLSHTDGLAILTVNHECFTSKKGKELVWNFLKPRRGKVMYVVDESHRIKTPSAKRTRSIILSGKYAQYRRILTGTPVANKPFDVYSQIRFLDREFWAQRGLPKFSVFKSHFGVFSDGFNGRTNRSYKILEAYRCLDELHEMIAPVTSRLLKEDVLDLPQKIYQRIRFPLTAPHRRAYDQLREECLLLLEDDEVTVTSVLTMMLRLQQVACGYVGTDEGSLVKLPGKCARLETLKDFLIDVPHQAIIWARFQEDCRQICEHLGSNAVRYDGTVSARDRAAALDKFHAGDVQFFVGNPAAGGTGLTLVEAKTVVYYNNSFNLVDRLQSEDRAHRIGQDKSVLYVDLMAEGTIDEQIIESLVGKLDVASAVTGDKVKEWLR